MDNKVLIIAEAGVNHNGDIKLAKQLIDVAASAKADYVKFQTFKAENLVSKNAKKASYQIENTNSKGSQYDMLKALELSKEDHDDLISYCKSKGVKFLSSAFDVSAVEYLDSLGLEIFKIPSGEITNYPYLRAIAKTGKRIILSTGMSDMDEIETALKVLLKYGAQKERIVVLHCNTEYPTPMKDVNLLAMNSIKKRFDVEVGYSDHTLGIEVPLAAVALGAIVIEKHFTVDNTLPGPDHKASLEPDELRAMVFAIRNIEDVISGNGIKKPSESEKKNKKIARKSIHAANDIKSGSVINDSDIIALRPGDGISPMDWNKVVGKSLSKNVKKFDKLNWSDFL